MDLKGKLIKLFEQSCTDVTIPKTSDKLRWELQDLGENKVRTVVKGKTIENYVLDTVGRTYRSYDFGFNFKEKPSLHLHTVVSVFARQYGRYLWIISYLFLNNYKRRKAYLKEAKALVEVHPNLREAYDNHDWDYGDKNTYIDRWQRFTIQGNVISEISEKEYQELHKMYLDSSEAYDLNQLNKRLDE